MEYQFYRDFSSGEPMAETPHELYAFGRWLSEELRNPELVTTLLDKLTQFSAAQGDLWLGRSWCVDIEDGAVRVYLHYSDHHLDQDDPSLHLDQHMSEAEAGKEDVMELLAAWHTFLCYR